MNTIVKLSLIFGALGLVAGYLLFGRVGGSYISPMELIAPSSDFLSRFGRAVRGVEEVRRQVFISGGVGALAGAVVGFVRK
ncbi:MAG: hypothetical protein EA428_13780 [Spirochaetaceae bacterium]|nr:MAG: hypothetical protein EA428_13780 [Spirochaetaceae bacterium]